jgi:ABC-type dipeptide/oligopeptide/nickel transport system ATPase subunit
MNPSGSILEARDLGKDYLRRTRFGGSRLIVRAFEHVDLTIREGATLAIVGESGAGKSSLARCLAFLETPSQGAVYFRQVAVPASDRRKNSELHREVQLVFQDSASAFNPRFTAEQIVSEPLVVQNIGDRSARREATIELVRQVGLQPDSASKRALELSGGQRQRLAIARALALNPKLLIFDESLSSLDRANQELILELLGELQTRHSLTYVHITHDFSLVAQVAGEIAVMHDGRIVEQKPAAGLFARPDHPATLRLLGAASVTEAAFAGADA